MENGRKIFNYESGGTLRYYFEICLNRLTKTKLRNCYKNWQEVPPTHELLDTTNEQYRQLHELLNFTQE